MKRKHYPIVTVVFATLLTVVPLLLLSLSLHSNLIDSELASEESRDDNLLSSAAVQPAASTVSTAAITESKFNAVNDDRSHTPVAPLIAEQLVAPVRQVPGQLPSLLPEAPIAIPSRSNAGNGVPKPAEAVVSELSEIPLAPALVPANFHQAKPVVAVLGVVELPTRPDAGASYYEATGHLALRTQPQVPDPLTNHVESPAPPDEPQAVADAFIEEVVIQTPVESALVSRVENVVAMTGARGWPIALVRSDLPDDVWWVQQVVGIQGNAFAARVNFGNEYSLSGSTFSMVIVFLDSPDEVRRFRIAKQFKDIPEGVRHSREFHYIRN